MSKEYKDIVQPLVDVLTMINNSMIEQTKQLVINNTLLAAFVIDEGDIEVEFAPDENIKLDG